MRILGTFPSIRAISGEKIFERSFNLNRTASRSRRAEA